MRNEILDTIIEAQMQLVANLKKSLETYESTTDLDEQSTIDLDDQSHQADLHDIKIEMTQKLQMEEDDLKQIRTLRHREADEVQEGAVVETDMAYFFFGFAFAPVEFKGKKVLGVSLEAPAFAQNEGKKKGDTMQLGDKKEKITAIY